MTSRFLSVFRWLVPGTVIWAVWLGIGQFAWAGDWPQILGPTRNGKASGETLADSWPAGGPKVLWTHKLGSGYAGPAVAEGRVIVFHRVGDQERIEALDAATGKLLWQTNCEATYRPGIDPDNGPRAVPLVAGEQVFVFGAAGDLHCLALTTGKLLWTRHLLADSGGDEGYFGAGSTPIFVGGKVLVNVGGRGTGLVAVDPATGKTAWQATDDDASYSSPASLSVGGREQAVFITRLNCVLADPASGKVQTLFPFGRRGPTVNGATPLVVEGKIFATASYGVGATYAALDATSARSIWSNDDSLSSQYSTPVESGGFLYGTHGREDQGVAEFRCVEVATGKVRWSQEGYGVASPILAGDRLLIVGATGRIALAKVNPARYEELASHQLVRDVSRALPALANGRLYVRTGSGGGQLNCLAVGK
jgi:outer membrane protein assembly factor BamB